MTIVADPAAEALEQVERGLAGCVERHDFAINYRVARQLRDTLHDAWKATDEILLIARPELRAAPGLAANSAEAVELQLVAPFRSLGRRRSALSHSSGSNENCGLGR